MDRWEDLIKQIHGRGLKFVLAITGGGSESISKLLKVPGGSQSLCEAVVPYSTEAVAQFLGRQPDAFCSAETALAMASVAWKRAAKLSGQIEQSVGIGATASLVSNVPKAGSHRCWIATQTDRETRLVHLTLRKNARTRTEEEAIVTNLIVAACGEISGSKLAPFPELVDNETIEVQVVKADSLLRETWIGDRSHVWSKANGAVRSDISPKPVGLISGAFNPIHEGHRGLRDVAQQMLGGPVGYELTIVNADKPQLDFVTIQERRSQFQNDILAMSSAPLFSDKAQYFPNTTFVLGYDTASRIIEPRFYDDSTDKMLKSLETVRSAGCRFLVAGRFLDGEFQTWDGLQLPEEFRGLFTPIPESRFRLDISSTAIRSGQVPTNPPRSDEDECTFLM